MRFVDNVEFNMLIYRYSILTCVFPEVEILYE